MSPQERQDRIQQALDIKEAAHFLHVTTAALRKWIGLNRITFFRAGRLIRFRLSDLEAFVEANSVKSGGEDNQ
jgi:excisionase family DNA binding protein